MLFAIVGGKKSVLRKTLYFLLVSGSIKVLGVKLLFCNTNCQRDRLGLLNLPPGAPVASPSPHLCWEPQAKEQQESTLIGNTV